jgi:hypothetical protein
MYHYCLRFSSLIGRFFEKKQPPGPGPQQNSPMMNQGGPMINQRFHVQGAQRQIRMQPNQMEFNVNIYLTINQ